LPLSEATPKALVPISKPDTEILIGD